MGPKPMSIWLFEFDQREVFANMNFSPGDL